MSIEDKKKIIYYETYNEGNNKIRKFYYDDGTTKTVVLPILPKTF